MITYQEVLLLQVFLPFPQKNKRYVTSLFNLQTFVLAHTGAACRREENFWRAREYLPERWLSSREPHAAALVAPFGRGRRMCPGKRFVELELHLLLAKVGFQINGTTELRRKSDIHCPKVDTLSLSNSPIVQEDRSVNEVLSDTVKMVTDQRTVYERQV